METKSKTMSKGLKVTCLAVFLFAFLLNFSVFMENSDQNQNFSVTSLFQQASANELPGDGGGQLKWSNDIDCEGFGTGDYNVCQKEGQGSTCSPAGSVTCTCGTNCD